VPLSLLQLLIFTYAQHPPICGPGPGSGGGTQLFTTAKLCEVVCGSRKRKKEKNAIKGMRKKYIFFTFLASHAIRKNARIEVLSKE